MPDGVMATQRPLKSLLLVRIQVGHPNNGNVVEMVYTLVLEISAERIVGSTPTVATKFNGVVSIVANAPVCDTGKHRFESGTAPQT